MTDRKEPRAALIEIFDSVQGEGTFVGHPMAFVRLATCPLRCSYCDTPHSYQAGADFEVALKSGPRRVRNPATSETVASLLGELVPAARRPHRVSITGGEPLVYPDFICALGERVIAEFPIHLETAAIDPRALRQVVPVLSHLSADYKLPETVGGADFGEAHVACVEAAAAESRLSIDVKIVLTSSFSWTSFAEALDRLRSFSSRIVLILQPVTPFGAERDRPSAAQLIEALERARDRGFAVRMLPQVHKQLAVP